MASGLIKNWRNRFFILEKGTLIYCEPTHLKLRGRYNLEGLEIMDREEHSSSDTAETIRLFSPTRPDICLIAGSVKLRERWVSAIDSHIKYANYLAVNKLPHRSSSSPTLTSHNSVRKMTVIEQGEDGLAFRRDAERDSVSADQSRMSVASQSSASTHRAARTDNVVISHRITTPINGSDARTARSNTTSSASSTSTDTAANTRLNSASTTPSNLTEGGGSGRVKSSTVTDTSSNRYSSVSDFPPVCEGWLQKQGAIFPSIRKRFFILDRGVMKYYRSNIHDNVDPRNNSVYSHTPRGLITITNYELFSDNSESIQLVLMPGPKSLSKRKLVIYCEDFSERDMWVSSINAHIMYNSAAVAAVVSAKSSK